MALKKTVTKKKTSVKKEAKNTPVPKKAASVKKKASTPQKKIESVKTKATPAKTSTASKTASTPRNTSANATTPVGGLTPYEAGKDEKYMNDDQRMHFREILWAWKRELMDEVDRTVDHMKTDAANFADPADRATQEEEFSLELRTRDRERKLIKKIDESIAQLDSDEYGYCEACGIEIGIRRLEARPTATMCIDCKSLQEIKEKQLTA